MPKLYFLDGPYHVCGRFDPHYSFQRINDDLPWAEVPQSIGDWLIAHEKKGDGSPRYRWEETFEEPECFTKTPVSPSVKQPKKRNTRKE